MRRSEVPLQHHCLAIVSHIPGGTRGQDLSGLAMAGLLQIDVKKSSATREFSSMLNGEMPSMTAHFPCTGGCKVRLNLTWVVQRRLIALVQGEALYAALDDDVARYTVQQAMGVLKP